MPSVSPKKRNANRVNAQRSTGPRTVAGRGRASRNATRHGLASPIAPTLLHQQYPQLLEVLLGEGLDETLATDLALRILDYERNQTHALQSFAQRVGLSSLNSPRARVARAGDVDGDVDVDEDLWLDVEDEVQEIQAAAEKGKLSRTNRKALQAYKGLMRLRSKVQRLQPASMVMTSNAKQAADSQRYFKRSNNQLIKALKRLGARV